MPIVKHFYARLRPTYNVVTDFGAAGDGSTDDTTAIQNAINAAHTGGSGVVIFPAGTYYSGQLTVNSKSNVELRGVETTGSPRPTSWTSTIKLKDNTNLNQFNVIGSDDIVFRWLEFDGNRTNQSSGNGSIYTETSSYCKVIACRSIHSYTEGVEINIGDHWLIKDSTFDDGDYGVILMGGSPGATDIIVENCKFTNMTSRANGFGVLTNGSYSPGNIIRDCAFDGCRYGMRITESSDDYLVQGNSFQNITVSPIYVSASDGFVIDDNTITGTYGSEGNDGMQIQNDVNSGVISNNNITGWQNGKRPIWIYGAIDALVGNTITDCFQVRVEPGSGSVDVISGNIITDGTQSGMYVAGAPSGMVFSGNTLSGNNNYGVQFAVTIPNAVITGNTCQNNGQGGGTSYGMDIGVASTGLYIAGNDFSDNQGTPTQDYGIRVWTGSSGTHENNTATGNQVTNFTWDGVSAA